MGRQFFNSKANQEIQKEKNRIRQRKYTKAQQKHILEVTQEARLELAQKLSSNPVKVEQNMHQCSAAPSGAKRIIQSGNECPFCHELLD